MRTAAVFILALLALPARASTSLSSDYSDLWFNPNESGWGVNMIQQDNTIFATLFVYGSSRQPTWYVASSAVIANPNAALPSFSGPLYQTSGPPLTDFFNPSSVTVRQVGTFTFFPNGATRGSIAYSVDGSNVFKDVERQTWKNENLSGTFAGVTVGAATDCGASTGNFEVSETLAITQSGTNLSIVDTAPGRSCNYDGGYTQAGRMGSLLGLGTCGDGVARSLEATELQVGRGFLTGKLLVRAGNCRFEGTFAGARRK